MKNKIFFAVLAALLVVAIVVGCIIVSSHNKPAVKPTEPSLNPTDTLPGSNPTQGSNPTVKPSSPTEGTVPGTTPGTNPTEGTNPEQPTKPGDPTTPTQGTNPNEPTSPVKPTEPIKPTQPEIDPEDTLPTEPKETNPVPPPTTPTEPIVPTDPNGPTATWPAPDPKYDFTGWTPGNITKENTADWDDAKIDNFSLYCKKTWGADKMQWPLEWRHNLVALTYGWYDCGVEGHVCRYEGHHKGVTNTIAKGCQTCGKTDCPALFTLDDYGFTEHDKAKCPEYDIKKDYRYYCQYCGLPYLWEAAVGEMGCQRGILGEEICDGCGETIYVAKCHHCIKKP